MPHAHTHFSYARIIELAYRPLTSVEEMNAELTSRWNETVAPDDIVLRLDDLALGPIAESLPLTAQLHGRRFLVPGNHDLRAQMGPGRDYGRVMANVLKVVAAVIQQGDQFLVCRRRAGKAAGGRWEFPGGKVEDGESAADALRREIQEELTVGINVLEELTTDDTLVGDLIIRLTCLSAELDGPRPVESADHDSLAWVTVDDLSQLEWAEPDLPAVRLLIASGT